MGDIQHFSTRAVAPGARLDYWNQLACEAYLGLCVDAPDRNLHADMWRWRLDDLIMTRPQSDQSTVVRADKSTGTERVMLHLQHRGGCIQNQGGRETILRPGDMTLCRASEPYRLHLAGRHETLAVELPRAALDLRLPDLDDRILSPVCGSSPGVRIFHDFLLSLWRQGELNEAEPGWQGEICDIFLDLLAMALRGTDRPAPHPVQGGERLIALVESRLCDPDLSSGTLADELGISVRSVQNLFARAATTPSAYILERRLARAAERLRADDHESITAIAYDLGFNDSAYFTRCFRQRFGSPPTTWRARH